MNPVKGQSVQVRFNNGTYFDGVVEEWSDQKSILRLSDCNDIVVIQKTLHDVLLVKILNKRTEPKSNVNAIDNREIFEEFEQLSKQPKDKLTLSRMAELKDEINKLEREEMFSKMKTFSPTGFRETKYGLPANLCIRSPAKHSIQEVAVQDNGIDQELQRLFEQD